jgi:hypothetical protein
LIDINELKCDPDYLTGVNFSTITPVAGPAATVNSYFYFYPFNEVD